MGRSTTRDRGEITSAFDDIFIDKNVAANHLIRARLMQIINRFIEVNGFTQQRAAEYFGTTQPRISDLVRGRIEKFSIDILVAMVEKAGWTVDFNINRSTKVA